MKYVTSKPQEVKDCQEITSTFVEDKISELPDDLLIHILLFLFLPTKNVVATMFLSKRWRSIWKMVPRLEYKEREDITNDERESVWWFLDNSMQHHTAPVLESLSIILGKRCPMDVDVNKWIENAIKRNVRMLELILSWCSQLIGLPTSLYTCATLVKLRLCRKIVVDVPASVCLTSLKELSLIYVVYKDEVSLLRLLSSCPVLEALFVKRPIYDNVTNFVVEVPSLKRLGYTHSRQEKNDDADVRDISGSLVIDCPALTCLVISDFTGDSCSSKTMPCLDRVYVLTYWYPNERFLISFSSISSLKVNLTHAMVNCCRAAYFPRLRYLQIWPVDSNWMEPLMLLLTNSPILKHLVISSSIFPSENIPLSWNQPDSVLKCLSSNLEILQWSSFGGRTEEKCFAAYILGNSKCLKKSSFCLSCCEDHEKTKKMREELYSMNRASTTSHLSVSGA